MSLSSDSFLYRYDNESIKYDFDSEVKSIIQKTGPIRRRKLIDYLTEKHKQERGYSEKSINRKIDKMADLGILKIVKPENFAKFGIKETDARATYLILKQTSDIKKHLDDIFKILEKGTIDDKHSVVAEIFSYEHVYVLDPIQLNIIAKNLDEKDEELVYRILIILYNHVIKKRIKPANEDEYLSVLKHLLGRYPLSPNRRKSLRGYIIALLGWSNDKDVVDQLIKDSIELEDLSTVEDEYETPFTSNVIENHRTELFNHELKLKKEGKTKNAEVIQKIKHRARKNLGIVSQEPDFPGVD
ncbi:hypothetical protein [Methanococcoides sp. AM1]|uniref:hypothetical protein n=1 Tax=Methanococcoides sp. AM1 TaxID=1201011 RepID=UPI0010844D4B|nr:hypothetical protein [Methanococcoides sp. AM1]